MKFSYAHRPTSPGANRSARLGVALLAGLLFGGFDGMGAAPPGPNAPPVERFDKQVKPILIDYCYDCHGDGESKGGVAFDGFKSNADLLGNHDLWLTALKLLRADIMPPSRKDQPSDAQKQVIAQWIKDAVFQIDARHPDPGRVTVNRMNRVEYHNTIHDLLGVDFDTQKEFPPDDSGHGFDNIADVLTISPMLLEKYLDAARRVVDEAVPMVSGVPVERVIRGDAFSPTGLRRAPGARKGSISLSYYSKAAISNSVDLPHPGKYRLVINATANERYVDNQFDYNKCRLVFKVDGQTLFDQELARESGRKFDFDIEREWAAGRHEMTFEIEPLTPDQKQIRSLNVRIDDIDVVGPLDPKFYVHPPGYEKFFPKDVPLEVSARRAYAGELLRKFATRAFRRPVDDRTVDRLCDLAETTYSQPGKTFEAGVAQAMVAVLASPRFLFREEAAEPLQPGERYPEIDEFSLASRLSYFLWSSMPDEELMRLAGAHQLRANLKAQVKRMLADPRSGELVRNFTGQWLEARDITTVPIIARDVLAHEAPPRDVLIKRFVELRSKPKEDLTESEKDELTKIRAYLFPGSSTLDLTPELREAMQRETEKVFDYVLRGDRSLLELIKSDYTFVNEDLARYYGLNGVHGKEMQYVALPPDSPRGGVLTEGTVLAVTSNPTRTSPVKRGLFILENILGTPPAPPPPNIPPLEDAAKGADHKLTLRETLAIHRHKPLCSSCHDRMDPLGLAFEHFDAMGLWRNTDEGQDVDVQGKLISGEEFSSVQQLKQILVTKRREDFYRCLTEKLMTYALGRGLDYYDTGTEDEIVARLDRSNGKPSELLMGIIMSAPFQKTRLPTQGGQLQTSNEPGPTAALNLKE